MVCIYFLFAWCAFCLGDLYSLRTVFIRRVSLCDIRRNLFADFGRNPLIDKLFLDGACVYPAEGAGRFPGDVT